MSCVHRSWVGLAGWLAGRGVATGNHHTIGDRVIGSRGICRADSVSCRHQGKAAHATCGHSGCVASRGGDGGGGGRDLKHCREEVVCGLADGAG